MDGLKDYEAEGIKVNSSTTVRLSKEGTPKVVSDKDKTSEQHTRKSILEATKKGLFDKIPSAFEGVHIDDVPENKMREHVIYYGKNPLEIAHEIEDERKTQPIKTVEEEYILNNIGKRVSTESFYRYSDRNRVTPQLRSSYLSKNGRSLDQLAMEIETEMYGDYDANYPRITEQKIVDFMLENPSSFEYSKKTQTEDMFLLGERFTEITGLPPTPKSTKAFSDRWAEITYGKIEGGQMEIQDDDLPFQNTNTRFERISKPVFDKFKKQVKSVFPNIGLNTFTDWEKAAGVSASDIQLQSYYREVNTTFNEQLEALIKGELVVNTLMQLGKPSIILQKSGIPNLPIELNSTLLKNKALQKEHPFDLKDVKNLPQAIQRPWAVFNSTTVQGRKVIFTELQHTNAKGVTKNFVAALEVDVTNVNRIEVNEVRSVYPRNDLQILKSINNEGESVYLDKTKMLEWIGKQQFNSAEVTKPNKHSTKVEEIVETAKENVKNFKNPVSDAEVEGVDFQVFNKKETSFLRTPKGTVYGFVKEGQIYLNENELNANTLVHEYAHIFTQALKQTKPEVYRKLIERLKQEKSLITTQKADPNYSHLSEEALADEVLASLVGNKGEGLLNAKNDKTLKQIIEDFWTKVKNLFSTGSPNIAKWSAEQFQKATIDDIVNNVTSAILEGRTLSRITSAELAQRKVVETDLQKLLNLVGLDISQLRNTTVGEGATFQMVIPDNGKGNDYNRKVIKKKCLNGLANSSPIPLKLPNQTSTAQK